MIFIDILYHSKKQGPVIKEIKVWYFGDPEIVSCTYLVVHMSFWSRWFYLLVWNRHGISSCISLAGDRYIPVRIRINTKVIKFAEPTVSKEFVESHVNFEFEASESVPNNAPVVTAENPWAWSQRCRSSDSLP